MLMSCYHEIITSVLGLPPVLFVSARIISSCMIKTKQHSLNRQKAHPLFCLETPLLQLSSDTPTSGINSLMKIQETGCRGDKIQNVSWRVENIPLPQSLEYVVISCGINNLDTDGSEKVADGLFCIALALKKRMNHLKVVINGILPRDEQNSARKQKLFIVSQLLESKCTYYVNTDIHYLSPH